MNALFEPTIKDLITCAKREVGQRRRVYARLVTQGKMSQEKADWEIACMEAIVRRLEHSS